MATTRTLHAANVGPVTLDVSLPAGSIRVIAEPRERAEIIVRTVDDSGPAADAVNAARLDEQINRITIALPRGSGGTTMVNRFGGGVSVSTVSGGTVISSGRGGTWVNGVRVEPGQTVVVGGSAGIEVVARVPEGSSINAETQSADIATTGRLAAVDASTQSGDINVFEADTVKAKSMSGDVFVESLSSHAAVSTMSGDISISGNPSAHATATSMSGNIWGAGGVVLNATTMSGRVRNR